MIFQRMYRLMHLILICILLFLWSAMPVRAQEQTVEAEGVAAILRGDTGKARDEAIKNAQRAAVEQVAGVVLSSMSEVQNYELTLEVITTQTGGFIKSYQVLEEQARGHDYWARIEAAVGSDNIHEESQAIQQLLQRKGDPRIMFLVDETIQGVKTSELSQTEVIFQQIFLDTGFHVVDFATVQQNIAREQQLRAIEGDLATAAALALQFQADVIITAKAMTNSSGPIANSNLKSLHADMTAKAIWADTGAIISSGAEQAKTAHIDERAGGLTAITEAATALANATLKPNILERWRQDIYAATQVRLTISHISFPQLTRVKRLLENEIRGVQRVSQREFLSGVAKLDVEIQNTAEFLAEELSIREFEGLSFEITGMSANTIDIKIRE